MGGEELSQESLAYDECAGRLRLAYGVALGFTLLGLALGLLAHGTYHTGARYLTLVLTLSAAACACAILKAAADAGYYRRVKHHIEDRRRARGDTTRRRPRVVTP